MANQQYGSVSIRYGDNDILKRSEEIKKFFNYEFVVGYTMNGNNYENDKFNLNLVIPTSEDSSNKKLLGIITDNTLVDRLNSWLDGSENYSNVDVEDGSTSELKLKTKKNYSDIEKKYKLEAFLPYNNTAFSWKNSYLDLAEKGVNTTFYAPGESNSTKNKMVTIDKYGRTTKLEEYENPVGNAQYLNGEKAEYYTNITNHTVKSVIITTDNQSEHINRKDRSIKYYDIQSLTTKSSNYGINVDCNNEDSNNFSYDDFYIINNTEHLIYLGLPSNQPLNLKKLFILCTNTICHVVGVRDDKKWVYEVVNCNNLGVSITNDRIIVQPDNNIGVGNITVYDKGSISDDDNYNFIYSLGTSSENCICNCEAIINIAETIGENLYVKSYRIDFVTKRIGKEAKIVDYIVKYEFSDPDYLTNNAKSNLCIPSILPDRNCLDISVEKEKDATEVKAEVSTVLYIKNQLIC